MHKILYLTCFPDARGGGQVSLLLLLEKLDRARFAPVVGVPAEGEVARRARELGCEVRVLPIPRLRHAHRVAAYVLRLRKLLKKDGISLIHPDEPRLALYAAAARCGMRVPVVWHVRAENADLLDPLLERAVDRMILVAGALERRFSAAGRRRSRVVHNGVEIGGRASESGGPLPDVRGPLIVCPGRVEPAKGQEFLVQAASRLAREFPSLSIWLAGDCDPAYQEDLARTMRRSGVEAAFRFLGFRTDIGRLCGLADMVVLPSLSEAFPRAVLDAMAAGKAVVASRVGGVPELLDDGVTGILVPPGNAEALAGALGALLRDEKRRRRMGAAARERVKEFSLDRTTAGVQAVYEECLPAPPGTGLLSALSILAYAALALPSLNVPPILWEWQNRAMARSVAAQGVPTIRGTPFLVHPPSIAYILGGMVRLFGDRTWVFKIPGFFMVLAAGVLIRSMVLGSGAGPFAAWLAMSLFLTNPFVVQGALCFDFADGSLLVLGIALFFWAFLRRRAWSLAKQVLVLGLCLCLCLWSKVPTAVLLASSFAFAVLLDREERRKPALCLGVLCVAGASFAATWGSFCAWLSGRLEGRAGTWIQLAMQPILYIHGLGSSTPAWRAGFYEWGLHSLSAAASLGPMLLAIALWRGPRDLVRTGRGRPGIDPIIPLFAFACLGLYEVFLGGARAYPKHLQAPIVSLAVMGALFLSKDDAEADLGSIPRAATWLAGLAAYYAAVVGDYLLTLNYDLRNAAYLGRTAPVLARFAEQWALYLLPLAVVAALRLCKGASFPWRRGLAIALLGSQLGLGAAQTRGGYDLHQAYGASTRDFLEVVRLLKESAAPGPIVADYGIADAAGLTPVRGFGSSSWNNPRDIESFIAEQKPKAVVYGIAIDTIDEMRSIRADERLQSLLSSHYSLRQAGSFFVWLRKEGP